MLPRGLLLFASAVTVWYASRVVQPLDRAPMPCETAGLGRGPRTGQRSSGMNQRDALCLVGASVPKADARGSRPVLLA
jgi:hypothetical protein